MKIAKCLAAASLVLSLAACSSAQKMAELSSNVAIECTPSVLEVVAGQINATVSVTYPDGYFNPKAILEVTPVIVYEGGEVSSTPLIYQGEKVKDNYKVVSKEGSTVTENIKFNYVPGMEKSYLELRGVVSFKAKTVNLPVVKVADGANTTYLLVKQDGVVSYKADDYQEVIKQTEEGQIFYAINSSDVRSQQLKSQSIKDFQAALDEIKNNERKTLTGTEVIAYASPDGGENLNNKLSDNRSKSAEKAWNTVTKGKAATAPEVTSLGEDWEGFQELVSKSDIEDKNLILRVLSMYSDPAVRENEIKNMSEVYQELKGEVLPELRRARFIANVEFKNYTPDELLALIDDNIDILDEEALLRAATLVEAGQRIAIYQKAVEKYSSDRAQFNIGVVNLNDGNLSKAEAAFAKVANKDGDYQNAMGVIALRKGEYSEAARCFAAAGTKEATQNMAIIDILNGNYAKAASELETFVGCCHNAVLANILCGQLDKAASIAKCQDPAVKYLLAIIGARKGNVTEYKTNLEKAVVSDFYNERAAKDIEFAAFRN